MIVVVGTGPAGLAAAIEAAGRDAVTIIDQAPRFGGQYWRHAKGGTSFDPRAQDYFARVLNDSRITRMSNTRVWNAEKRGNRFFIYTLTDGVEDRGRLGEGAGVRDSSGAPAGPLEHAEPVVRRGSPGARLCGLRKARGSRAYDSE